MNARTPVSKPKLDAIRAEYPQLPDEYFDYLVREGYGEAPSGRMIYSGPIEPSFVYGARFQASRIVLLGDDMQGYCFGFDLDSHCLGEISASGEWEPWPPHRSFLSYTLEEDEDEPTMT